MTSRALWSRLVAICLAIILAAGVAAGLLPAVSEASAANGSAQPSEQGDVYVNDVHGYSVQYDASLFGVEERNDGAGQTTFYLLHSPLATPSNHGSRFTVNYMDSWDGFPDYDTYFEGVLYNARNEAPDSFVQMSADPYVILEAGEVPFPTVAWTRVDAETGQEVLEIRIMALVEGGGCAFFGMTMVEDDLQVVADALGRAVRTFRVNPDSSGGTQVTWVAVEAPQTKTGPVDQPTPPEPDPAPAPISYTATEITDGYSYYFTVPAQWTGFTEFGGYGESSLLEAYDYSMPSVRMSFWGLQEIPGNDFSAQFAGVPIVMESGTVAEFVEMLPQLSSLAAQSGQLGMPDEVRILSAQVLSVEPVSAVTEALAQVGMDGLVCDEAIVTARVILDDGKNTEVTALIYGTVAVQGIGDFVSYSVMSVYGIFAPPDMFNEVARALAESGCGEFTLHEHYLNENDAVAYDVVIYASSYQLWRDYILSHFS